MSPHKPLCNCLHSQYQFESPGVSSDSTYSLALQWIHIPLWIAWTTKCSYRRPWMTVIQFSHIWSTRLVVLVIYQCILQCTTNITQQTSLEAFDYYKFCSKFCSDNFWKEEGGSKGTDGIKTLNWWLHMKNALIKSQFNPATEEILLLQFLKRSEGTATQTVLLSQCGCIQHPSYRNQSNGAIGISPVISSARKPT